MNVHEDLLNNGENNCSFTEDEVDIMCSKDGDDACGDSLFTVEETLILCGLSGFFEDYVPVFLAGKNVYRTRNFKRGAIICGNTRHAPEWYRPPDVRE